MHRISRIVSVCALLLAGLSVSQAQDIPAVPANPKPADPEAWVGATPSQAFSSLGPPQAMYAVRGIEPWQDDVVFVYDTIELYWFRDRVWQVRANSSYGIRAGDSRETVISLLGEPLQRLERDLVFQIPSRAWPLRLRVRFAETGGVADLFLYRGDF